MGSQMKNNFKTQEIEKQIEKSCRDLDEINVKFVWLIIAKYITEPQKLIIIIFFFKKVVNYKGELSSDL